MEDQDYKDRDREELFSRAVRAGKRTYFFDVKATIGEERYLTITESKRRFSNEQGKFVYEKHKIFLYQEDFEKFFDGLHEAINFIKTGQIPEDSHSGPARSRNSSFDFEDLHTETEK